MPNYEYFKDPYDLDPLIYESSNWGIEKESNLLHKITSFSQNEYLPVDLEKQIKMDMIYLRMANEWSKNSYCKRAQVGCLVVNEKSIISDGYNGSPTGFPNVCESELGETLPWVLHAEANAITKIAKNTQSSEGSTIYVTLSPCYECSKLIIQSGIKRLVFSELYRKTESLPFLIKGGVDVFRLDIK
jgi:dCMP deaminase